MDSLRDYHFLADRGSKPQRAYPVIPLVFCLQILSHSLGLLTGAVDYAVDQLRRRVIGILYRMGDLFGISAVIRSEFGQLLGRIALYQLPLVCVFTFLFFIWLSVGWFLL